MIMFKDFDTLPAVLRIILFAIPFSHPMMAIRALMFDDYLLVLSGIAYVVIFAAIMVAVVAWIFRTDRLLTGGTKKRRGVKLFGMGRAIFRRETSVDSKTGKT
jgi:ABC-2 type transport system permease protein